MTLTKLYSSHKAEGSAGQDSRALLRQAHWFAVNAEFDPKTGKALPQALSTFLAKLTRTDKCSIKHDRLWRITEHARPSVERLLRTLNESPRREQALLPVHAVRELDANSFIKLSNRPGRNIREKLAGKPYLQAVRRFQSVNLPENRLLKAFVTRLAELMELRRDCLGEEADALLPKINSWFRSDEAQAIARWENLPPNNTLLSHRDYRRVWDAWRWLQSLDDVIARDFSRLEAREETMRKWNEYGQMYAEGMHRFAEMPVLFDYEEFTIKPWTPRCVVEAVRKKILRFDESKEVAEPACVDLTTLRPRYAIANGHSVTLRDAYVWQQWKNNKESVDIQLFHSDAAYLHPDARSVTATDLFFYKDKISDLLFDRAARAFIGQLRTKFKNDNISWLVPDFLNDFELETLRRNLNARFPGAEPLPRSVAAVFEQVDYSKVNRDGFSVVVVDSIGGKTCATKLVAKSDPELKKRLPQTRGYYWERCPPVIISHKDAEAAEGKEWHGYDMITVNGKGQWHDRIQAEGPQLIDLPTLRRDPRIGQFEFGINLTNYPVAGGIRLYALQQRAGDIPLWRDNIPELSIKGYIDGLYRRFYLVGKNTRVPPVRGKIVSLEIKATFPLPKGKPFYSNLLYQGANADELGFSARLDSPAFPLKTDAVCKLSLTFEYGADEPYKLIFTPLDKSFPPVRATWRRTEEIPITDAPAPEFPTPRSWNKLRNFPDTKRGGTIDLVRKFVSTAEGLTRGLHRGDDGAWGDLKQSIHGLYRFLFFSIWRDGRSISDSECPTECTVAAKHLMATLCSAVMPVAEKQGISRLDLMVLFCATHKDAPSECVQWITEQVESGIRDRRAIGFALGEVTEGWQERILRRLASKPNNEAISVFSYAIWREQHFVEKFSISELRALLKTLLRRLKIIEAVNQIQIRSIAVEPLELLIGLLRTRTSTNHEIKMLLQPHQKITKELAKQVERVTEIVARSNVNLFSRVQLNLPKPTGDRTPDLLYALRLYLTGDDGANAIHITSVSDNDDD